MITMIGAIATFERELILERQREGVAIAKAKGRYRGRISMKAPDNFKDLYDLYMTRRIKTKKELAKRCKCSMPILYRFIRELEEKQKKENEVNEQWQYTIWRRRWSAGAQDAPLWPPPLI